MGFDDKPQLNITLYDEAGNAIDSKLDEGVRRLEVTGLVVVTGASPPEGTGPAVIFADTPLTVSAHDTEYLIPDGEAFHLQELVVGNEDPTKGAVVELIYDNGTEHLIARVYSNGFTLIIGYPSTMVARDGTVLAGNAGQTHKIIVRRSKYSGSAIAIDAVVRGYSI
jgi:hypothetical protein